MNKSRVTQAIAPGAGAIVLEGFESTTGRLGLSHPDLFSYALTEVFRHFLSAAAITEPGAQWMLTQPGSWHVAGAQPVGRGTHWALT